MDGWMNGRVNERRDEWMSNSQIEILIKREHKKTRRVWKEHHGFTWRDEGETQERRKWKGKKGRGRMKERKKDDDREK